MSRSWAFEWVQHSHSCRLRLAHSQFPVFMTDSRTGFGGLGCGPSQLTEGETGCIFLPQRVTNPAMNPAMNPLTQP